MSLLTFRKSLTLTLALLLHGEGLSKPAAISPETVVVLYNSDDEASRDLALHYAKARSIPRDNLVGLPIPPGDEISREQFNQKIHGPLRRIFDSRGWWVREKGNGEFSQPVSLKRRVIVTMLGVPFKIARTPDTIPQNQRQIVF